MWAKSLLLAALVIAGSTGLSAAATPAYAQASAVPAQPSLLVPIQHRGGQDIRSLREVVEELRARYGGDLISARLEDGGRPVYFIRWRMPDGQVRDFRVDAAR